MAWVDVLSQTEIEAKGKVVVRLAGRQILLLSTERGIFAFPNRCPHEGYPLSEGTLDSDCRLTCNWHNWKFDIASGANLTGGDGVRLVPIRLESGRIWLDLVESSPAEQHARIRAGLIEALADRDYQRLIRETARLARSGLDPVDAVRVAVSWGQERFRYGMTHALAGAAEWLALYDDAVTGPAEKLVCIGEIIGHIADDIRHDTSYPFAAGTVSWSETAFLAAIEREDEAAAIGLLRGALADGAGPDEIEPILVRSALVHYQDFGHALIYAVKSSALIRRLGQGAAAAIWLPYIRQLVYARREDLLPEFRDYGLRHREWGREVAIATPLDPTALRQCSAKTALKITASWAKQHSPEAIFACLVEAASWALLQADIDKFQRADITLADDATWLDLTHMVTFAEAGARAAALDAGLWPAVLLQLACFIGRNAAHIDAKFDPSPWLVADVPGFRAATRRLLVDHGVAPFILSVHLLKTAMAAEALGHLVPKAAPILDAAANRFLHTPIKPRHILRVARQMQDFVTEE